MPELTPAPILHPGVIWTPTAFRHDPVDILRRVLDVAGLAVHAILRVDLETLVTGFVGQYFVHTGRAIPHGGLAIKWQVLLQREYPDLRQLQMTDLVLFVIGTGKENG